MTKLKLNFNNHSTKTPAQGPWKQILLIILSAAHIRKQETKYTVY